MATLGDETDPDADSVRGMLAAKVAELSTAIERIGSTEDGTGLLGDLATKQAAADARTWLPRMRASPCW